MGYGNLDIPIQRGSTYYNGRTIDTNDLAPSQKIVGQIRTFDDVNPTTMVTNSNLPVTCILLRNKHSVALTPGQAIRFSTTVDGESGAPCDAATQLFAIVDEYLPAAGVPVNDLFWAVIGGPCTANMVTVAGAKTAGQLAVGPSTTAGKLDFTSLTPGNATVAQQNARDQDADGPTCE